MEAECLNEDCDRDRWSLRKHPSQYARDGPTCPDCGTSRIGIHGADGAQQAQEPGFDRMPDQHAQPQPAQQGQGGVQGGAMPAVKEEMQESLAHGVDIGDALHAVSSDDPDMQAVGKGKLLQMGGSAFAQLGQRMVEEKLERRQRAKQATDDDIAVSDDYPNCPECGSQLTNIPAEREFPCPSCGTMLEIA